MAKIIILDYNLGNLFSVKHACTSLGLDAEISQNPNDIKNADALILPGVGAFNEAMNNLKDLNLVEPLLKHVKSGKPIFGICLGLQLLFTASEEFGSSKGLDLIPGKVLKFPKQVENKKLIVPKIGWNTIYSEKENTGFKNTPLDGIKEHEFTYFVHSYYVLPDNEEDTLTYTNYEGHIYCSAFIKNNIFATQFHPEKSGEIGLKFLENFINWKI